MLHEALWLLYEYACPLHRTKEQNNEKQCSKRASATAAELFTEAAHGSRRYVVVAYARRSVRLPKPSVFSRAYICSVTLRLRSLLSGRVQSDPEAHNLPTKETDTRNVRTSSRRKTCDTTIKKSKEIKSKGEKKRIHILSLCFRELGGAKTMEPPNQDIPRCHRTTLNEHKLKVLLAPCFSAPDAHVSSPRPKCTEGGKVAIKNAYLTTGLKKALAKQ